MSHGHSQGSANPNPGARLADAAEVLKDDLTTTGKHLRDGASETAGAALQSARKYGKQGMKYATNRATAVLEATEECITDNPWKAVGIAVGAGVLLGMFLKGRNKD